MKPHIISLLVLSNLSWGAASQTLNTGHRWDAFDDAASFADVVRHGHSAVDSAEGYDRRSVVRVSRVSRFARRHDVACAADSVVGSRNWAPFDGETILVQIPAGAGSGLIVFVLLSLVGNTSLSEWGHWDERSLGGAFAGLLGAVLGGVALPTGVHIAGGCMGGNGRYIWTLLGGLGGGGIALLPNIAAGSGDPGQAIVRAFIGALAGSILGYHFSATPMEQSAERILDTLPGARTSVTGLSAGRPHPFIHRDVPLFGLSIPL